MDQWSDVLAEVKPAAIALVQQKTERVVRESRLPQVFVHTVEWDIVHVCMEAEYADVYQPGYYASQAYWYVKGHFPCGWQGDFPNGKLIIY